MSEHEELQFDVPQGAISYSDWVAYTVGRDLSEDLEQAHERGVREEVDDPQTKLLCDGGEVRPAPDVDVLVRNGGNGDVFIGFADNEGDRRVELLNEGDARDLYEKLGKTEAVQNEH